MIPVRIRILLFALLAVFPACRMSPEEARGKLTQQNIPFSEVEFFKRIEDGDASVVELFLIAGTNANAMTEPSFRITDHVLETLKGRNVPDDVLKRMESKKDQQITGGDEFLSILKSTIGDESATKFQSIILQYAKSDNGQTALMAAARKGHTATIKALLDRKANVNGKNKASETPLLVAAFNGHIETVKTLLNAKADLESKDDNGITPLMAAAYQGQTATVQTLLSGGGDANARDNKGDTALMQAAEQGHNETVQALLAQGADALARNQVGLTAMLKAFSNGHTTVVQSLLTHLTNGNPGADRASASTVTSKAYVFAEDGFIEGRIEVPSRKSILTEGTSGEIALDQIAIMKMGWEHKNMIHSLVHTIISETGQVRVERQVVNITAKVTPKTFEVLLRSGQALSVQLENVKPDMLDFVTKVDGEEVRLELPLRYFEADYMKEDSRRRLTLEAPFTRINKGWKVKHVLIDFT